MSDPRPEPDPKADQVDERWLYPLPSALPWPHLDIRSDAERIADLEQRVNALERRLEHRTRADRLSDVYGIVLPEVALEVTSIRREEDCTRIGISLINPEAFIRADFS